MLKRMGVTLVVLALAGCSSDDGPGIQPDGSPGGKNDVGGVAADQTAGIPDTGALAKQDTGTKPLQPQKKACKYFCSTLADCPQGAVACQNKACLQCTDNSHCQQYPSKTCDKKRGVCLVCTQDSHCTYQGQKIYSGKCATQYGECVRCTSSADCNWPNSTTKICLNGICIACQKDADCQGASMKRCNAMTGFCSLCKTSAECCPSGQTCGLTCDPKTGYCLCSTAKQCSDAYQSQYKFQWDCQPLS
jgi:hypothetical protein